MVGVTIKQKQSNIQQMNSKQINRSNQSQSNIEQNQKQERRPSNNPVFGKGEIKITEKKNNDK